MAPLTGKLVKAATYSLLAASFALGVAWFAWPEYDRWEPAVNTLTLVGGLTGVIVERITAQAGQRRQILDAIRDEVNENLEIVEDPRFSEERDLAQRRIFPRLRISAIDTGLASGGVSGGTELFQTLLRLRDHLGDFNRRLEITEVLTLGGSLTREQLIAINSVWARGELSPIRGITADLEHAKSELARTVASGYSAR